MTHDPASMEPIRRAIRRALGAWRRARAMEGGLWGGVLGVGIGTALVLVWEGTRLPGLVPGDLLDLWPLLALPVLGALGNGLRALPLPRVARELDRRADLDDRCGTAWEFADDPSPLAAWQRQDAARALPSDVVALFPAAWAPTRWLGLGLLLCLFAVGAALLLDLSPRPPAVAADSPADDLLAAIEREVEVRLNREDTRGVRLLQDLAQEVRRIEVRREELRRRVAERPPSAPPVPEPGAPPPAPPAPAPSRDLITADDLERIEALTTRQLQMSDPQLAELTAELFSGTRTAAQMNKAFHEHVEHELDAMAQSPNASSYGESRKNATERRSEATQGNDLLAQGAQSARLSEVPDVEGKGMDMVRRDLSVESQTAHDAAHNQQQSFNDFLKDFVKDMQDTVSKAAMGKKPGGDKPGRDGREVAVSTGERAPDKRDAMKEAGFEELGADKRGGGEAPSEPGGQGFKEGEPGPGEGEPGEGPPPKDPGALQKGSGEAGESAMAIKAESAPGATSAGASGAGTGGEAGAGTRAGHLEALAQLDGPLDEVLGKLGQGRLPDEERSQLFDRITRHEVQAGLASEADDVLLDYFAEADEALSEEEQLSPLFRDYAASYFDSIRPGGARAASSSADPESPHVPTRSAEP